MITKRTVFFGTGRHIQMPLYELPNKLFHAGAKDVGANGSGVGGRGKQYPRIQGSFFKKIMLGKIISAVCKLDLSPQIMLLIFFLCCFYCFMPYNSN